MRRAFFTPCLGSVNSLFYVYLWKVWILIADAFAREHKSDGKFATDMKSGHIFLLVPKGSRYTHPTITDEIIPERVPFLAV